MRSGSSLVLGAWLAVWVAAFSGGLQAANTQAETYAAASVDAEGRLVVTTSDGRTIVVTKDAGQRSWGTPLISPDRRAIGVTALHANCCTSYDLPLALVVYSRGTTHRFRGNGLPIFDWHFADRGTHVAYGQQPAHFGCSVRYQLREITSERLIDAANVPEPCAEDPSPGPMQLPTWVAALRNRPR